MCIDTGFPKLTAVICQDTWDEIFDALLLSLDALGDAPEQVDNSQLSTSLEHLAKQVFNTPELFGNLR